MCIPSGYANFEATAVSFLPDASVLAIAFGSFVTLWDLATVALLTALRHDNDDDDAVLDWIQFLRSDSLPDGMMLMHSKTCVSLRLPYGSRDPAGMGWNWVLPMETANKKTGRISCVEFLSSEELVAVAQYCEGLRNHGSSRSTCRQHDDLLICKKKGLYGSLRSAAQHNQPCNTGTPAGHLRASVT